MAEEEEQSWDQTTDEWLVKPGHCNAGGMAQLESGGFYAAAPVEGEAGWGIICKVPAYEQDITQDDGSVKKMMIDEMELLHTFVTAYKEGKRPESATGLWMGGTKYTITSNKTDEDLPKGEQDPIPWFFGAAPKKGVHFCITKSQVVAGFYSEEANQTTGNCKKAVLEYAEYLLEMGY